MLHEFLDKPEKKYDFCVCGAGAAGITLAIKLAQKGAHVVLLEGGGLEYSQQSQEIYKYKSVGMPGWLELTRLRYLGGTTNHWTGRSRPFAISDFNAKTINGLPGWPIRKKEIDVYLDEALAIIDIRTNNPFVPIENNPELKNFHPAIRAFSDPPTRFGKKYLDHLTKSKNIDLFLNANVVDIRLAENLETVSGVTAKNYGGTATEVRAGNYIVCMGGVENARILLNSDSQIKGGIGNHASLVGACYMDHLNVPMGEFVMDNPPRRMEFYTSDEFINEKNIGKSNVTFRVVQKVTAYGRTKKIKEFFQKLSCDMGIEDKVQFLVEFNCPGEGVISTLCEQSPDILSRVYLDEERDPLGMRRIVHDWRLNARDKRTIRTIAVDIAKQFAEAGLGRVQLSDFILNDSLDIPLTHHSHHMGTTRMAERPEHGVVDRNCRVFNTKNLYIGGSSIFATAGIVNPTMPLIQFALRLADHLAP